MKRHIAVMDMAISHSCDGMSGDPRGSLISPRLIESWSEMELESVTILCSSMQRYERAWSAYCRLGGRPFWRGDRVTEGVAMEIPRTETGAAGSNFALAASQEALVWISPLGGLREVLQSAPR